MESARTSIDRVFHEWDYEMERAFPAFCVDRKTLDGEGYNVGTPCHGTDGSQEGLAIASWGPPEP